MYAASIPLSGDKNPSKDGPKKSLVLIELDGDDDHHLYKRADLASAEFAFASREKLREEEKEKKALTEEESRKTRDTSKQNDKPKNEKHRIVRDTPTDKDPKRVVRDIPEPNPNDPSHQPPKPSSIEKRHTDKDQSKKNFDGEHSAGGEHKLVKRSTDKENKDKKPVDTKDDKHNIEKRASDKAPEKKQENKPKREAKDSKPDPKETKKLPPKTSASSAKNGKN